MGRYCWNCGAAAYVAALEVLEGHRASDKENTRGTPAPKVDLAGETAPGFLRLVARLEDPKVSLVILGLISAVVTFVFPIIGIMMCLAIFVAVAGGYSKQVFLPSAAPPEGMDPAQPLAVEIGGGAPIADQA
jgi:hypothetical protein